MTSGQSLYVAVSIHPRYLKDVTICSVCPHSLKAVSDPAHASSSISRRIFLSKTYVQRAVVGWRRLSDAQGTNMLQSGNQGWGWLPSPIIAIMSCTWR